MAASTAILLGTGNQTQAGLRFAWDFNAVDPEEFVGITFAFGRTAVTPVNPNGTPAADISLPEDSAADFLNLLPGASEAGVSIDVLRFVLRGDPTGKKVTIKCEAKSTNGATAYRRFVLNGTAQPVTLDLPLTNFLTQPGFTWRKVKLISLLVEERHVADGVRNPQAASFDVLSHDLVDRDGAPGAAGQVRLLPDYELVELLARQDFFALLRMMDPKTSFVRDRHLTPDLLATGPTGWLLGALPVAVERQWISRSKAIAIALRILRHADQDALWHDGASGAIGNSRGLMYQFLGLDPSGPLGALTGTRKIDAQNAGTLEDETNNVACSTYDTALFQFGAMACGAGFQGTDADEMELRMRVAHLLARTKWDELVNPATGRIALAWKPAIDDHGEGRFAAPAAFGGFWSSNFEGDILDLDVATDEEKLANLLAIGSSAHPVPPATFYLARRTMGREAGANVTVSFSGAWFTYAFWSAIYADPNLGTDRGADFGVPSVAWNANARAAFEVFRLLSPEGEVVLPDAMEDADTLYRAAGNQALSEDANPEITGTRAPYSLQIALGLGGTAATQALAEIRRTLAVRPETYDPIWGMMDAWHPGLDTLDPQRNPGGPLVRETGAWIQQAVFSLNKGAALLAQLNYLSNGRVWRLANSHPVLQRATRLVYTGNPPPEPSPGPLATGNGRDLWSCAKSGAITLFADSFREEMLAYDEQRTMVRTISTTEILAALSTVSANVEVSGGPAGLRDVAAHPEGGWVVLIAGPGTDVLLRVTSDFSLSVLSTAFGEAMNRGDETSNFPRLTIGASPAAILVTVSSPQQGIAVVGLDGVLQRVLPIAAELHGIAIEPGTSRVFASDMSGTVWKWEDYTVEMLTPATLATLPAGTRDLAWNATWRTETPELLANGTNGLYYRVAPESGVVTEQTPVHFSAGFDISGRWAAFAQDEGARIDLDSIAPIASADSVTLDRVSGVASLDPLGNDQDEDGDLFQLVEIANISGGSVSLSGGIVTFSAADPRNGGGFDYLIADSTGLRTSGHVTILPPANLPPAAGNDVAVLPENATLVRISPLTNDQDPDGDTLTILSAIVSNGGGSVETDGATLIYFPSKPRVAGASILYQIVDPFGATSEATVTFVPFFAERSGRYTGIVTSEGSGFAGSGMLTLTLARTGTFSATFQIGGPTFRLRGTFGTDGAATLVIRPPGQAPLTLTLRIKGDAPLGGIAATIENNGVRNGFSLGRTSFSAKRVAPQTGSHTAFLIPNAALPDQGTGFALMQVSKTGSTRLTGRLPDMTPFTARSMLRDDATLAVFIPLYTGTVRGFIAGELAFTGAGPVFSITDTLSWTKGGGTGFSGPVLLDGGSFRPPATAAPILMANAPKPNATLQISGGGLVNPVLQDLHLSGAAAAQIAMPNSKGIALSTVRKTGFVSGRFKDAGDAKPTVFAGAIVSKYNSGAGVFSRQGVRGKVGLAAK